MPHVPTNKTHVRDNVAVGVMRLSAEEYATSIVAAEQQVMYQLSSRMYEFMQKHPDDVFYMIISRWEWQECDDASGGFELYAKARFEHDRREVRNRKEPVYDEPVEPAEVWGTLLRDEPRAQNARMDAIGNYQIEARRRPVEDIADEYWAEPAEPRVLTREAVDAFVQGVRNAPVADFNVGVDMPAYEGHIDYAPLRHAGTVVLDVNSRALSHADREALLRALDFSEMQEGVILDEDEQD